MYKHPLALAIATALLTPHVFAENTGSSLSDAIKEGEATLDFRLRFEEVDQSSPAGLQSDALTLRTRLNYKTAEYQGFEAFLEVDHITAEDKNSYNSTVNGEVGRAVIADPVGTDVNQAWLVYKNWHTEFKYGRQRINLDNQRFIGSVGFRQNEQTYDAFSITNHSLSDTQLFYARVNNVNRIFGEDSAAGDHANSTDLFNVRYSGFEAGVLTAYAYWIDNDDVARFSTDTYGLRFSGNAKAKLAAFDYVLEYATQEGSENNPLNYSANYLLAEGEVNVSGMALTLGYELQASDDGHAAFMTPLATLHKFQGWADQFLTTPAEGVADTYISFAGKVANVKLLAVYHSFSADENNLAGDNDLGDELGLLVAWQAGHYGLSLKYAAYNAGDASFGRLDTDKLWLTATAKF